MLSVKALQKQYGAFRLNVSFEVPAGQIVGLVGRNGAGKSTTFHSILGLTQPDHGQITFLDQPVTTLSAQGRSKIGVFFPDSFFPEVFSLTELTRIMNDSYPDFDATAFITACTTAKLPLTQPISSFSTGMLALVKLLSAMSHHAQLLLLDEPTAGLDVIVRDQLLGRIQDYLAADENRSVLISSHISSDLEQLCDVIIMLDNGQIILQEETDKLLADYAIVKMTAEEEQTIDHAYLLATHQTDYGYAGLTNQRAYYQENYPALAVEKGNIDDILRFMTEQEVQA